MAIEYQLPEQVDKNINSWVQIPTVRDKSNFRIKEVPSISYKLHTPLRLDAG